MAEFIGTPDGRGRRFGVVVSRFNERITRALHDGALDALTKHGALLEDIDVYWVPGAWELSAIARRVVASGRYDAAIALGAVIRGDTPHFEYVAGEASRGLSQLAADYDLPVGFGLLTCDTMAQAEARAGGEHGNKGWDAAVAALEMADLFARLDAADEE
ncbi:MAG: 6,7-dimethyl-8-ribityllumazine synthase [Gemmatimonadaceae bacterium]